MSLLPRGRAPTLHRRAHSSALEICSTTFDNTYSEKEAESTQTLLDEKVLIVPNQKPRIDAVFIIIWALSILLTSVCTYITTIRTERSPLGSFGTGFSTELRKWTKTLELILIQVLSSGDQTPHIQLSRLESNSSMVVSISKGTMVSYPQILPA